MLLLALYLSSAAIGSMRVPSSLVEEKKLVVASTLSSSNGTSLATAAWACVSSLVTFLSEKTKKKDAPQKVSN